MVAGAVEGEGEEGDGDDGEVADCESGEDVI